MNSIAFPNFKTQLLGTDTQLQLQVCTQCQQSNYPPRELCGHCLSDALQWQVVDNKGVVQAQTLLQHSMEAAFADALPLRVISVKLNAGPVLICHGSTELSIGQSVSVYVMRDRDDNALLFAVDAAADSEAIKKAWMATGLL